MLDRRKVENLMHCYHRREKIKQLASVSGVFAAGNGTTRIDISNEHRDLLVKALLTDIEKEIVSLGGVL